MKVLQILPSLELGGVERGVIDLVRVLKRRGVESVVISSGGELVGELQKAGIPHYTLPVHRKSVLSLALIPKIAAIVRREHVDMVHARSRVPAWLAWFAARQAGIPFVTTCHGHYSAHFLSRIMGWGKRVIVISQAIGRHMIDDFGVAPERIRLVHRGVDLSQFKFVKRDPERERPVFRIINVGRFSPIKGQVEFLKAVHYLRHRLPHIEVWLVGSEGKSRKKYTEWIERTIHQLGLESCVKLLGPRRDIPALLAQSDLLVMSTLVPEGFGRVLVEAGAVGTPVLATKVGGILDILEDGKDGRLVPPGDVEAMGLGMLKALQNREESLQFASRLREKVESRFSLEHMTDRVMEVYREVQGEKRILLIKLGAMGDLVLAVPSFRMLRKRFPESHLGLLVDKRLAPIVSGNPYLNELIPLDRRKLGHLFYLLKIAKRIRREGFDLSVDLQNSKWTHLLAALAGVRERYGFRRGKFGFLLNRPDRSAGVVEPPVRNQFRILSRLGVHQLEETLELWPAPEAEARIEQFFSEFCPDPATKKIGFVMGASPKWPTKRWPAESFYGLAKRLIEEFQANIVLIGDRQDGEPEACFRNLPAERVVNLIGKTSLPDLVSVLRRLDVLVTGDTAPLHVAGAMGTKMIALFGPTDPRRHAPPGPSATVLSRKLDCQPCYRGICRNPEKLACLRQISTAEVFEAVRRVLHQSEAIPAAP